MRLQTDRKIEIIRLVKTGPGTYAEVPDDGDPSTRADDALIEGREYAPEIEAEAGTLLLVKVLE